MSRIRIAQPMIQHMLQLLIDQQPHFFNIWIYNGSLCGLQHQMIKEESIKGKPQSSYNKVTFRHFVVSQIRSFFNPKLNATKRMYTGSLNITDHSIVLTNQQVGSSLLLASLDNREMQQYVSQNTF